MIVFNGRICDAANMPEQMGRDAHSLLIGLCPKNTTLADQVAVVLDHDKWAPTNEELRMRHYLATVLMVAIYDTDDQATRVAYLPILTRFVSMVEANLNICTRVLRSFKMHTDERAGKAARSSSRAVAEAKPSSPNDAA